MMSKSDDVETIATDIIGIITGALNIAGDAGAAGPIDTARSSLRALAQPRPDAFELVSRKLIAVLAELPKPTTPQSSSR